MEVGLSVLLTEPSLIDVGPSALAAVFPVNYCSAARAFTD